MKITRTMSFEGGAISVKLSGYAPAEVGSGFLTFRDDDLDYEEDNYRQARIAKSELIAIRDFLNAQFPPDDNAP